MLVPLSWLREFTPYEGTAQALGDKLTMLGLELEEITHPFAGIEDIVVGYVRECEPHPDSDHLHCCKVDAGSGALLDIVCGAPNVAAGQKVAVAPVGSRLPDGTVIKKAKLRGQPSHGMICSERELGLSEDHSGIMVLPETMTVGQKLIDALELDRDVLDISVTPNRADCLSIMGMAREAAIAFDLPFNVPDLPLILADGAQQTTIPVEIDDPELCWLYAGRVINDIKVEQSPLRIRSRLLACGIRPISNVVDVTNYILMETGQPLHSFDLDKLGGGRIVVQRAREGEKFITLDGKERILKASDLCICDAQKAIALAGVMGGQNSEIDSASRNVFLESAVFNPACIRKTSRRLGLSSEASYRFERGIDQRRSIWAMDRACAMLAALGGGIPNRGFSCAEPRPFEPQRIAFAPEHADALLGKKIEPEFQKKSLEAVGCAVENFPGPRWIAIQPSWRPDLTREADLIEEVGRIYGLDAIEPAVPTMEYSMNDDVGLHSRYAFLTHIRRWGSGLGLNEAVNYSFTAQSELDFLNLEKENRIAILNPLSEEQNVLRTCLAPGLLQDVSNNLAFGAQSIRLFELANAFLREDEAETGAREVPLLGICLCGLRHEPAWPHKEKDLDYQDIKGIVEHLLHYLGLSKPTCELEPDHPYLEPCVRISLGQQTIGRMGAVRSRLAQKYNAQKKVWLAELNLEILKAMHKTSVQFRPLPLYPAVRRDMTVIAPPAIAARDIMETLMLLKMPLLEGAVLVDLYEPEGSRERNLTFRLTFRHPGRTLKDEEVDREREKAAGFLMEKLNVKI